ncbi:MAG: hypothetical protein OHK0046_21200 [Anaerolineae bacterium]
MNRRNRLADLDPLGRGKGDSQRPLSVSDADAALFGELEKRESTRQAVSTTSIFSIYPDVQQPRRAVPLQVRQAWSGEPRDMADLFTAWLEIIHDERMAAKQPPFDLNTVLWAEAMQRQERPEEEVDARTEQPGPFERAFLKVVDLAVSIRRDSLANPVTIQRMDRSTFKLETGERRWLAFHLLYSYFHGDDGRPDERARWEKIPAIVVDEFNVWRQASENTARADLNAIGRARQYAILLMDLLQERGTEFQPYRELVKPGQSDRSYYAQVVPHRVPNGTGEMLANGMGVSHRAAFTRCRSLLSLPDEVWILGDNFDLSEDDLLRLARYHDVGDAIAEAHNLASIVASRNNLTTSSPGAASGDKSAGSDKSSADKSAKSPALLDDPALKRGERLFSKENEHIARTLFALRDGVGQAERQTKQQILSHIEEMRRWLDHLEDAVSK